MKQTCLLFLLTVALFSQPLHAGDKNDKTSNFWATLRSKVESLTPQKKLGVTTATGGVRGAPAATDDLYWKNDASVEQITGSGELDAFAKAMKLIDSDDKVQAQAAFSEFINKYPESALRQDAAQALALLQNASAPAK